MFENLSGASGASTNVLEEAVVVFEPASGAIVYANAVAGELFANTNGEPGRFVPAISSPN